MDALPEEVARRKEVFKLFGAEDVQRVEYEIMLDWKEELSMMSRALQKKSIGSNWGCPNGGSEVAGTWLGLVGGS